MRGKEQAATDEEICRLLSKMDSHGMDLMFDTYYKRLVVWGDTFLDNLEESEDLVQEFFIYLWENKDFRKIVPVALHSFLYVSVRNRCLHLLRKRGKVSFTAELDELEIASEAYNERYEEILTKVEGMIAQLPPQSRRIVSAVFVDGLKYREVAEKLGVSLSTVKTLVKNSIQFLRKSVKNDLLMELLCIFWNRN